MAQQPETPHPFPAEEDPSFQAPLDIQKLRLLVVKDELTRLYNRRYFRQRLDEEYRRWKRQKRPFSLMVADVNDFKEINDRYGHPIGDRVLVEISRILSRSVREIDIVCRYAGDEFVFILPDIDEDGCRRVAARVGDEMAKYPWNKRLDIPIEGVSLCIGYAIFPVHADRPEDLIEKADRALGYAKRMGTSFCAFGDEIEGDFPDEGATGGPDVSLPSVGRKAERKELFKILELAWGGRGQFALIRGDLGMGKTQLLTEAESRARLKGFTLLKGNCFPETRSVPYYPFLQILEGVLKKAEGAPLLREMPEKWMEEVERVFYAGSRQAGGRQEPEAGLRDEPGHDEYQIFEFFSSFLNAVSSSKPVMISLENLQWIDPSSTKLAKYLGRQIRDKRVFICCTAREEGVKDGDGAERVRKHELHSLQEEKFLREISLEGLKEVEIYALIDRKVKNGRIDRSIKEQIFHLSEGNPLFALEVTSYLLREKREILEVTEPWGIVPLEEIIPPNIYDLFERNLVGLDPEVKSILSYASVIGQEFDFGILLAISGRNEGHLLDIIDAAAQAGLVRELDREEGDRYVFTPFLVGRVLYKGLGEGKRRILHQKVGEVIELLYAKSLSCYYGVLSYHFQKGGEFKKAIRYAELAGDRAQEVYGHEEAIRFYSSSLEMLEEAFVPYPHDMAANFFGKRGRRFFALGEYPKYLDDFRSMLTCSREAGRRDLEGKAMVYLSSSLLTRGNLEEARKWAELAAQIGRDIDDRTITMLALQDQGGIALYTGRFDEASRLYQESLQISRELQDEKSITRNLSNIGVYHWYVGNYDEAVKYYQTALKRLEKNGDKHLLALNLNNLGAVFFVLGRLKESIQSYQESIILSREIKNRGLLSYNYNNLGEIYQALGGTDQALTYHTDALKLVRESGERYVECDILRNLGIDLHLSGRTSEGVRYLKNALKLSRKMGKLAFTLSALFDLGSVWLENGEEKKAAMLGEELVRAAKEAGNQEGLAKASFLEARILEARGRNPEALEALSRSLEGLSRVQNSFLLLKVYALLWKLDPGGDPAGLEKANALIRRVEGELGSQELRESFRRKSEVALILRAISGRDESLPGRS